MKKNNIQNTIVGWIKRNMQSDFSLAVIACAIVMAAGWYALEYFGIAPQTRTSILSATSAAHLSFQFFSSKGKRKA